MRMCRHAVIAVSPAPTIGIARVSAPKGAVMHGAIAHLLPCRKGSSTGTDGLRQRVHPCIYIQGKRA